MKHCKLEDIVDALETQTEMHSNYLDTTTEQIILLSEEELTLPSPVNFGPITLSGYKSR